MANTRKVTNLLLTWVEEGVLDPQTVLELCLSYMSEADVEDMARSNDLLPEEFYDDFVDDDA